VTGFCCCTEAPQLRPGFDLVLITVKSYDTAAMAKAVAPYLAPWGHAISLQNGLGNIELLEAILGAPRVLGGRVIFGATLTAPGCARVTVYADPVLLGAWTPGLYPPRDEAARRWAAALARCGIPAEYTEELRAALWAKAFYNAALNPLGALLGVHYGALAENAETRAVMDAVIREAFAVAEAEGVKLPWTEAEQFRALFYEKLVPSTWDHRASMLQDLERGRRTEIDAINGAIWQRAAARGISTPVNEVLTRLVRFREGRPCEA
jgi:2-dehydropantoate 2-reductase